MELLLKRYLAEKKTGTIDDLAFFKDQFTYKFGSDFNRSIANIIGLVSLLDEGNTTDPDFETICRYLSVEAKNLNFLVKDICH